MIATLKSLFPKLQSRIDSGSKYVEYRIAAISIIAIIGFPLYYFIWKYLFPQPYENLPLRLFGAALFIPFLFYKHWPGRLRQYRAIYWYIATLYALPFFFSFMLLKNNASDVWLLSGLVALFMMILLLDWRSTISQLVIGLIFAIMAYRTTTETPVLYASLWSYIPIYAFVIAAGIAHNLAEEHWKQEQMAAMLAMVSDIAHELRTPLLSIKVGSLGLAQYLPALLEAYDLAQHNHLPVAKIKHTQLQLMDGVLDRISQEADHSNRIIEVLLMNTRLNWNAPEEFGICSMQHCLETAMERYPFRSSEEKQLITWDNTVDFKFCGMELLMVHVLFNLLKNALHAITKADKGNIVIRLQSSPDANTLIFRDTGIGIAAEIMPHIFSRFYSWTSGNPGGKGAGVGLAFCSNVMEMFAGSISCHSEPGVYTEFMLTFPPVKVR